MSHFCVYVFSKDTDVESLLAPYDENIEVSPYVKYTREQAIAEVRKEIEDYKDSLYAKFLADPEEYKKKVKKNAVDEEGYKSHVNYLENEFPKMLEWTDEECYEYEAQWYKDNDMIDDNGNLLSTYNPKSKWDWYSQGGRWSNSLILKNGEFTNEDYISEIDWGKTGHPFAFITPDGEWHEKGEMGWWACVSNEKDNNDWEDEYNNAIQKMLSEDEGIMITLIDCHI